MDAYILIAIAFISGLIVGAVLVEALVSKRINQTEADNGELRKQLKSLTRNDNRDPATGRYVGA